MEISERKMVQVGACGNHTIAVDEDGTIFTFGCNQTRQVGVGQRPVLIGSVPKLVNTPNELDLEGTCAIGLLSTSVKAAW